MFCVEVLLEVVILCSGSTLIAEYIQWFPLSSLNLHIFLNPVAVEFLASTFLFFSTDSDVSFFWIILLASYKFVTIVLCG